MKLRTMLIVLTTIMLLVTLGACGSSDGVNPSRAELTLFTSGMLTTSVSGIGSIDVTIVLPPSVTVKSSAPTTDIGVVVPSRAAASGSIATGIYTAATSTVPAMVRVLLMNTNTNGFGTGEFARVICDLNGSNPAAGDFTVKENSLVSYGVLTVNTLDISSSLNVGLTVELK